MNKFTKLIIVGCVVFTLILTAKANAQSSTPFVTGQTLGGRLRNDFTGWVGMEINVGATPITVTNLGRWVLSGNTGTHSVELVQASNGAVLGTVSVNTSGAAAGAFDYASLGTSVTLTANTSYYVLSQEANGGDQWYDASSTDVTTTSVATVPIAMWSGDNTTFTGGGSANQCFVPVNFEYSTSSSSTSFVTGQTLGGRLRNDFTGWVGMEINVGATPITVTNLGRWVLSGNTGTHSVELVQASNGAVLGTVSVNTSGAAAGAFDYASLGTSVTLTANTSYYVLSYETNGGDQWYDASSTDVATTSVATVPIAMWSGDNTTFTGGGSANQCFVPVNFEYSTSSSSTSFVTGQALGTLRNDYTGWVGLQFTVGSSPITVTQLGRWVVSGNTDTHSVELVQASNGAVLGTVSVNTSGVAAGAFGYASLGTSVTLTANTSYYVLSYETSGGDQFYEDTTTLATTSVAAINNAEYQNGSTYYMGIIGACAYGPVSFQYGGSGGGTPTTAVPANTFLNSLGVCTHMSQGIDNPTNVATCLTYAGIRNVRDDGTDNSTLLNSWISIHDSTGAKFCPLPIENGSTIDLTEYNTLVAAGALLAVEGPNEPNNFPVTYNGATSSSSNALPTAQFQAALYSAVAGDSNLDNIPVFTSSEAGGSEPNNVGLQFLTIPSGSGVTLMPTGTHYADYANCHNYVMASWLTSVIDNTAWDAEWPTSNVGWDSLYGSNGVTWNGGFAGYSATQLQTLPRVTTETGWTTSGTNSITQDQQGKLFLNLYLTAAKEGWSYTFIYMLRDDNSQGYWGLFDTSYNAKLSGTYLHNLTTILADTTDFTPDSLNYSVPGEPATVHDLLIEKSDGKFELAVWDDRPVGEGTDNVTVNLGGTYTVTQYDPTVGTSGTSLGSVSSVSLSLSDHPIILQIP